MSAQQEIQQGHRTIGAVGAFLACSAIALGGLGHFIASFTLLAGAVLGWRIAIISLAIAMYEQEQNDA